MFKKCLKAFDIRNKRRFLFWLVGPSLGIIWLLIICFLSNKKEGKTLKRDAIPDILFLKCKCLVFHNSMLSW